MQKTTKINLPVPLLKYIIHRHICDLFDLLILQPKVFHNGGL